MSKVLESSTAAELSASIKVERTLTVFDNETERLVEEHPFEFFELNEFTRHFAVDNELDPLMYDAYAVWPDDVQFLKQHLSTNIVFDFNRNSYFVECSSVN